MDEIYEPVVLEHEGRDYTVVTPNYKSVGQIAVLNNELEKVRDGKLEGLSHYIFALDGCWDCQIVKCLDEDALRDATTSLVDGDFVVNKRLKKEYHPKE